MASSRIIYYTNKTYTDGSHPICLRLTFDRKHSYITLASVKPEQWDERNKQVIGHANARRINNKIKLKDAEADDLILEYDTGKSGLTRELIIGKLKGNKRSETLTDYINDYIKELEDKTQFNDASSKGSMRNEIIKFNRNNPDIRFQVITPSWLRKFHIYLKQEGKSERTIYNYMNMIRSLYNRAISDGVVNRELYPFDTYKLVMPESEKIGLDQDEVDKIIKAELKDQPTNAWELAKWTWLLSLAFGGARVSDVLMMKWSDFKNDRYYYVMGKNNKPVSLPIPDLARKALEFFGQYRERSNGFVVPELAKADFKDAKDVKRKIKNANRWYNRQLQRIAEAVGIDKTVSMHIARHTFGNLTGDKISPQLLQMIYRHSDIRTTMNYQQHWMNQEKLDEAIKAVVDF
ncbi:MAG: site-specific integrase [Flavobacteriales bacterium]|nr:site-specific integrase [Flavobacteriales bacterium]